MVTSISLWVSFLFLLGPVTTSAQKINKASSALPKGIRYSDVPISLGYLPPSAAPRQMIPNRITRFRYKNYQFSGRRRTNKDILLPGAVLGDGVSKPIATLLGATLGETSPSGLAPRIVDALPLPQIFRTAYPGLEGGTGIIGEGFANTGRSSTSFKRSSGTASVKASRAGEIFKNGFQSIKGENRNRLYRPTEKRSF